MLAPPSAPFDAVRWTRCRSDKRGVVTVDGRATWRARHGTPASCFVGVRADTVEILADRGRRVAVLPQGVRRRPCRAQPALARPGADSAAASVRRVRDQARHARGRSSGHRLPRRRGPPPRPQVDQQGRRSVRLRGCLRRRAKGDRGRARPGRRATVDVLARRIAAGGPLRRAAPTSRSTTAS